MKEYKVTSVVLKSPMLFPPGTIFSHCPNGIIATRAEGTIELIPWHEIRRATLECISLDEISPGVEEVTRPVMAKPKGRR